LLNKGKPELPGKHASNQEVLDAFLMLITQEAAIMVGEPSLGQPICCPTSVMCHHPHKEVHFGGAHDFHIRS
jgi:hypothetical protein